MSVDWTNQRTNIADFVQQWEMTEQTKEQTMHTLFSNERGLNKPNNKPPRLCSTMREDWTNPRTNLADFVQQWERTEQTKEQTSQTLFNNERGLNKPKNKPCRLCSAMREDWTNQRTNLCILCSSMREDWTNHRTKLCILCSSMREDWTNQRTNFVQQWERTEQTKEQTLQTLFSNERGLKKPKNKPCRLCSSMREDWTNHRTKLCILCSSMREDWTNQRTNFVQQWERIEQTKEQTSQTLFSNERGLNKPKNKPCRLCSTMREDLTNQRTNLADFVVLQWDMTEQTKEQTLQTLFSNERGLNKPKNKPCRLCSTMREDLTNQRTNLTDFVQQWERTEQTKEQTLQTLFNNERGLNKPKNKPPRLCSAMREDWTNQRTNLADFVQQWERI